MDDLISRQAVIDAIRASTSKYTGFMEMEMYTDDDAVEAINGVPSAQQWIPCSERKPDGRLNKSYLVQDKDGRRAVGTYTNWGWMFAHYMNDPVAWMPLPEPYKEERKEE